MLNLLAKHGPSRCMTLRCLTWLIGLGLATGTASAQAPVLTTVLPAGVQKGAISEITLTGSHFDENTEVRLSFPARIQTLPGGTANQIVVRIEAESAALLGWHVIHVVTTKGISNPRLFCVDELEQVRTSPTPHTPEAAQTLVLPCVVSGIMEREKSHWFKFTAQAGERLSFEVLGRRLGSPVDPQLALLDAKTRRQLAFSDDAPAQQKDPRLQHVFAEAGEYLIELRDVRYQGGPDWHYRLRVGDFPLVATPFPLAVERGQAATVTFAGPAVDPQTSILVRPGAVNDPWLRSFDTALPVFTRGPAIFPTQTSGLPSWPVPLLLSPHPERVESGSNSSKDKADPIPVPGGISSRFLEKGGQRFYKFAVQKGRKYQIEATSHAVGSAATVQLTLLAADGRTIASSNPTDDPVRLIHAAADDGELFLQAEHVLSRGGPAESFRLTIKPVQPGFQLRLQQDRIAMAEGTGASVHVVAERLEYGGPIELFVEAGTDSAAAPAVGTIPAGQNQTLIWLPASAANAAALRIRGRAKSGGQEFDLIADAEATNALRQRLANLRYLPPYLGQDLAVHLTPAPPFTLAARYVHPTAVKGLPVPVAVTTARSVPEVGELNLVAETLPVGRGAPPLITPLQAKLPVDRSEVIVEIKPTPQAPDFLPLRILASGSDKMVVATPLPPLRFGPPFDLAVESGSTPLRPAGRLTPPRPDLALSLPMLWGGLAWPMPVADADFWRGTSGRHDLQVRITRQGGYRGPIVLELQNLPAGVTAEKVTVRDDATTATLSLQVAADAKSATQDNVLIVGTASAAGNQQNRSPGFKLVVAAD